MPSPEPPGEQRRIVVIGGGAAGFFAAIHAATAACNSTVLLLEKSPVFLAKVRISGGGRCNVTHACFDPRKLAERYARGGRALIGPFHRFQPRDTIHWFEERGVRLKTEADGRMFPTSDSSETIIDCLLDAARACGVELRPGTGVESIERTGEGRFALTLKGGGRLVCDRVLIATGGVRSVSAARLATFGGHTVEPPVPSLFTFNIESQWLRRLPGVSVEDAEVSVPTTKLRERGPVLVTHWGLSGPAILRLSAWGARELHALDYQFPLRIRWLADQSDESVRATLQDRRETDPGRLVANSPMDPLPARLWEQLVELAGIAPDTRWARLTREGRDGLIRLLLATEVSVNGKSLNKEEFVTCGGVHLREVDFRTMESRLCPGLFFAGEVLDVDGITGGFNFQAAWTTGWIAGHTMAEF